MKVIFLDIDGVLTDELSYEDESLKSVARLREEKIKLLKQLVDETDAKIVMHSTWRFYWEYEGEKVYAEVYYILIDLLKKYGLELYDCTPIIKDKRIIKGTISLEEIQTFKIKPEYSRAATVNAWLEEHPEVESFVIFDDANSCWEEFDLLENWIKTYYWGNKESQLGILPKHIEKATQILNASRARKR